MGSRQPRIYVDADVLMAAAGGTPLGAPTVLLIIANMTALETICAETAVLESRRNVEEKLPEARPALDELVEHGVRRVDDPPPDAEKRFCDYADEKDAIHLAAAVIHDCRYLVTYNLSHYEPGHEEVEVVSPGLVVQRLRAMVGLAMSEAEVW